MILKPENTVIVTDLDGTFLNDMHRPPQSNLDAVRGFIAAGGRFTLATGRYGNKLEELFSGYKTYLNAPAVMCNGAYLYNAATDEIIYDVRTDAVKLTPILTEILKLGLNLDIKIVIQSNDGLVYSVDPPDFHGDWFYKCVIGGEPSDLDIVRNIAERMRGEDFILTKSWPVLFEILNRNATKGRTMTRIKDYYAERGETVYTVAAGDYENDTDMLKSADVAVCPSNALDSIKAISKYILCDNNRGAIADLTVRILHGEIEI